MASPIGSQAFNPANAGQVNRWPLPAGSRRVWIDLECEDWSDGVLLVEFGMPGGGPDRALIRLPAAGWGGPFDLSMAENISVTVESGDSAATEATVVIVSE